MPTKKDQDAELWIGKTYDLRFDEVDDEGLSNFNDLTYAFADDEYSNSNHFVKYKSSGGITVDGSGNDIAVVRVDSADTSGLDPGLYYHELETEDASGNNQTAAIGEVELQPSRTN